VGQAEFPQVSILVNNAESRGRLTSRGGIEELLGGRDQTVSSEDEIEINLRAPNPPLGVLHPAATGAPRKRRS